MKQKSVFAGFLGLALLLTVFGAQAGEQKLDEGQASVVIPVTGMSCGACCVKIETAVKELDGIVTAKADYEAGNATITYVEDKLSVETIVETINEKTSFKASMPEEKG
jgi:copper chaperone CopZ